MMHDKYIVAKKALLDHLKAIEYHRAEAVRMVSIMQAYESEPKTRREK